MPSRLKTETSFSCCQIPSGLKTEWRDSLIAKPWKSMSNLRDHEENMERDHACSMRSVTTEPALPPPEKFQRSKTPNSSTTPESKDGVVGHVVVSLHQSHMFLHVSDQLCDLLHYKQHQLSDRSVNILYGPKTNQKALDAAIFKAGSLERSSCKVKIYCRDGTPHDTTAILSPVAVNYVPVACLIEFADWDIEHVAATTPAIPCSGSCTPQKVFETHLRQYYHRRSNFKTGLSIECASRAQRKESADDC